MSIPKEDERTPGLEELASEGPIFRDDRFGAKLSAAANAYLEDYVYSPEEFVADHEPTEFEYQLLADFLGGLFADEKFSKILHTLIEKQTVQGSFTSLREALAKCVRAIRSIGDNIAEFDHVTDDEFWDDLWEAEDVARSTLEAGSTK